ncbi:uncharacterized protein EI90DRAFT_3016306 [Cantharellus anzutake]|uniref:uncharacterized protein n=1 Tax=Cantharellus anzutake TaxID=1750568 RepID=UPI0019075933|nr:uncharacterized protein EI90DRAFT_3016306 [Cantharellus anzutake]KAF8331770.1 hypothetical protein EI90DRAFT_3016306 [Cantharellus anzutake]
MHSSTPRTESLSCSEMVSALGEPPNLESVTLQMECMTPPTEPSTPENKAKSRKFPTNYRDNSFSLCAALPELGGYDDSSKADDGANSPWLLGARVWFGTLASGARNIDLQDKMFEEKRWQTNPLRAYREGIEGVIAPSEHATALPGV